MAWLGSRDARVGACGAWLSCVLVLAVPAVGSAQAPPTGSYKETIAEAVREFSAGRWAEARALFKQAHAVSPNARTLRGMGMAAYEMRLYTTAISELEGALLERRKPLTAEQRAQAQGLIDAAWRFVGRYRLVLAPTHAQVTVDGKAALLAADGTLLLDAGVHEVRAEAQGYSPASQRLRVEGGENAPLELSLVSEAAAPAAVAAPASDAAATAVPPPAPAVPASRAPSAPAAPPVVAATVQPAPAPGLEVQEATVLETFAWVSMVGAAGFGAASGVFWVVGEGQYSKIETRCRTSCTLKEIDDSGVETSDLLTNVFFGLAVVSGATGIVLFAIDAQRTGRHDALAVRAAPGGISFGGHF